MAEFSNGVAQEPACLVFTVSGGSQSVVSRPVVLGAQATSMNLLEIQILGTYPRATDSEILGLGSSKLV